MTNLPKLYREVRSKLPLINLSLISLGLLGVLAPAHASSSAQPTPVFPNVEHVKSKDGVDYYDLNRNNQRDGFEDWRLSPRERATSLLSLMTLEEKVLQLTQLSNPADPTGPAPDDDEAEVKHRLLKTGLVGSVLNASGKQDIENLQRFATQNSRLGIPMVFAMDVVHGYETIFPIPLAEASSWDLALLEKSAQLAAKEASAQGLNWTFAPMVDISRDPRWGRVMEGAGEDPYLGTQVAIARVNGFQGDDLAASNTIAATLKHFAGYGFGEGGRDYDSAEIGAHTLHNVVLPTFKTVIEESNAASVMNGFNTLNGVPSTSDAYLQRTLLKGEWGYEGLVVSDWKSIQELVAHGVAANDQQAAQLALSAGSDMDMESTLYSQHLAQLINKGSVSQAQLDDAVKRVLVLKIKLGLFEDPFKYLRQSETQIQSTLEQAQAFALELAEASVVLLKNQQHTLPLTKNDNIAVIGALASDKDAPLGNWRGKGSAGSAISLVEGLQAKGLNFAYAKGAEVQVGPSNFIFPVKVNNDDRSGFAQAVDAARNADKVLMVVGETAYLSGEGRSRAHLGLPGLQQELLEAVHAVNPNIVMVVMSGRPQVLSWADKNIPAILQAWHLGSQSGNALANILTGEANPSGKLPMTFPRAEGQIPIYYNHLSSGRPGPLPLIFWRHYADEKVTPLYPFGHGLSYTEFAYSNLNAAIEGEKVVVSVDVTNTGKMSGKEVVQLYIRDLVSYVSRPVKELKGFEKILLNAGAKQRVSFTLDADALGYINSQGQKYFEPGEFTFFVGSSSDTSLATNLVVNL